MKQILLLGAALIALAGCNKTPQADEQPLAEITIDTSGSADTMPDMADNSTADLNESTDNSTEASEPEEEEDPNASRQILEYVNYSTNNDLYVFRDTDTGCEFIQIEKSSHLVVLPRPDGKGGHRGCKTGTDFVKPKKEELPK